MRKTKIICTIGPSSNNEKTLRELIESGMNVARINFSHGGEEVQDDVVKIIKKLRSELNKPISLMMDTKGSELRIGKVKDKYYLNIDDTFVLYNDDKTHNDGASINYKELYKYINEGSTILMDDGIIKLHVKNIKNKDIICTVMTPGYVSSNKSINVPNLIVTLPTLTDKDKADIKYCSKMGFDYIAASFIRRRSDIVEIRNYLNEIGDNHMRIIAKIENREGINNFKDILDASDGVMVARGDLGVEIEYASVPIYQKMMIEETYKKGKLVVTATQMLDSMMNSNNPTRAEVSDVANSIYDGSSAIMLSGETAVGNFPIECVRVMSNIANTIESNINYWNLFKERECSFTDNEYVIDHAMITSAMNLNAKCIVCYTIHGDTPSIISSYKPNIPIYAITKDKNMYYQMGLYFGITPILYKGNEHDTRDIIMDSLKELKNTNLINKDDLVVIAGGKFSYDNKYESSINKSIGGIYRVE